MGVRVLPDGDVVLMLVLGDGNNGIGPIEHQGMDESLHTCTCICYLSHKEGNSSLVKLANHPAAIVMYNS